MLQHILGLDNPTGPWYLSWSGWVGDLSLLGGFIIIYRRFNCHVEGCHRVGTHHVEGTPYATCRKHHPVLAQERPTVHNIHQRYLNNKGVENGYRNSR